MYQLSVLFLGWDFFSEVANGSETNSYWMAKAMSTQLAISLILPKANPDVVPDNINVTGLNNINFDSYSSGSRLPKAQPFAEADYIRQEIPLYGSPDKPENQRSYLKERRPDFINLKETVSENSSDGSKTKIINIFDSVNWDTLTVDSQTIEYARFATRFAADRSYDLIFASNWLTYLAGIELQLVTSKPLAIYIPSLSQDHSDLNNQGWKYELEKMAIKRCDYIFTPNSAIASNIKAGYQVSLDKIFNLDSTMKGAKTDLKSFNNTIPLDNAGNYIFQNNFVPTDNLITSENPLLEWEIQANKIVKILTDRFKLTTK
ncbi:hypothetical protein [Adhaeribacter radiodurans]|uniref:Glycosyltransferase n=1 Tax=Adhaeribacter radiodurans TaxID=2745197 RepID=A0A7L7L757_9BACT|nr:hypothetical protein [Adhaeribacter radiodurans]QMU28671.1 hypothetical protein HUW48_11750 [Adhaeribacter radiodurans]